MSKLEQSSLGLLSIVSQETDKIGVGISFGKDSMATLDLCCRCFKEVAGYYLARVRDLEIVAEWSEAVFRRYGVRVREYPHFDLARCYRHHVLQPHWNLDAHCVTMADIEKKFRTDFGVEWIAYGWRASDSFSRLMIMKQTGGIDFKTKRVFPLRKWLRRDVYAYLEKVGIPIPDKLGRKEQGGLDFHPDALSAIQRHQRDWNRWREDFPFSELQLRRDETTPVEDDVPVSEESRDDSD